MLVLKYLLVILGIGLFGSSGALVAYDIYLSSQLRRLLGWRRDEASGQAAPQAPETSRPLRPVRWGLAQRLALAGVLPLLVAFSIAVVPDGFGGVRVSQLWGARPGTLYPGVYLRREQHLENTYRSADRAGPRRAEHRPRREHSLPVRSAASELHPRESA